MTDPASRLASLLTTPGADYADDRALALEAGYSVDQPLR